MIDSASERQRLMGDS